MAGDTNRPSTPFSLRLTFEERAKLEQAAGDQTLSEYIRGRVFDQERRQPRRRRKAPVKDQQALGRVLGMLGEARLANNLNQLARAANTGSLPVTPDTERALRRACADVREMRNELIKALGLREPRP